MEDCPGRFSIRGNSRIDDGDRMSMDFRCGSRQSCGQFRGLEVISKNNDFLAPPNMGTFFN